MATTTALLACPTQAESKLASDIEIASIIFQALSKKNPKLQSLTVVRGSFSHAITDGIVTVHKIK